MDTTSLYYFLELTRDLHMTRAAERLFISQQTLSNHILRLEKQLGCQLFERKPSLRLTYAGEQVRAFAEQTLREQGNLLDILADVENQQRGTIRFGASTLRLDACLPAILPAFSREYPHVELQITDQTSRSLEPMILNGELDFALVAGDPADAGPSNAASKDAGTGAGPSNAASGDAETDAASKGHSAGGTIGKKRGNKKIRDGSGSLIRRLMIRDPIYLCATDAVLREHLGGMADSVIRKSAGGADLQDFAELPFLLFQNRMGLLVQRCFEEAGIEPRSYIKAPYTQVITKIGLQGVAAFFSTGVVLRSQAGRQEGRPDNLHVFPVLYQGQPLCQEIYLVYSKDRYISRYAARFLELLRECFSDIEQHPVKETNETQ